MWIWVCVCVCQARGQPGGMTAWRMDGCEKTALSCPFHSAWVIHLFVSHMSIRLSDAQSNSFHWWIIQKHHPSCLPLRLCVPCGHLLIAQACVVHQCAFVNRSGHPASSVFFIEISVVFQKQVLKNKCRNVVPRCWCTLQMVPLSRQIHSSPLYLVFFSHWRTLQCLLSIISVGQTNNPTSTHCFSPASEKNNEKTTEMLTWSALTWQAWYACLHLF